MSFSIAERFRRPRRIIVQCLLAKLRNSFRVLLRRTADFQDDRMASPTSGSRTSVRSALRKRKYGFQSRSRDSTRRCANVLRHGFTFTTDGVQGHHIPIKRSLVHLTYRWGRTPPFPSHRDLRRTSSGYAFASKSRKRNFR